MSCIIQEEHVPAYACTTGLCDIEGGGYCHGGVDGIPALVQDLHARLAGEWLRGGHYPAAGVHRRPPAVELHFIVAAAVCIH